MKPIRCTLVDVDEIYNTLCIFNVVLTLHAYPCDIAYMLAVAFTSNPVELVLNA